MSMKRSGLPELVRGPFENRTEVLRALQADPEAFDGYAGLGRELQENFMQFCLGERGLNITCDPVFKKVFDPETHPERLEDFLSLCLGEELKILRVMPNESSRLTEDSSLLVMDILVRLSSGALVNVEIQRMGYYFPGSRCACYSSDLVMRQYVQAKKEREREGKRFSYKDVKKVYTVVLIEESTKEFKEIPDQYLHYSKQVFSTGLKLDLLQEYLIIPLDIFRKCCDNTGIRGKLDAWLYFISSDRIGDIKRVVSAYPEFETLYREVFEFRYHVKELVSVYSKILSEYDANTVKLMIEECREEAELMRAERDKAVKELHEETARMKRENEEAQAEVARLKALLEQSQAQQK